MYVVYISKYSSPSKLSWNYEYALTSPLLQKTVITANCIF